MATPAKKKFSYKHDEASTDIEVAVTATLRGQWENIHDWLRNAPDCADDMDVVLVELNANQT